MNSGTAFYYDEMCMWHSTGEAVLYLPVGGWLQPPAGSGHPESPESKRRFRSLLDVSGLASQLAVHSADPADENDLKLVHTDEYINEFKKLSAAEGGRIGPEALFSQGGFEIAALSAGLAKRAVSDVINGHFDNAYALSRPPGHHCNRDQGMGFCLLANIAIAIETAKRDYGIDRVAVVDWDVHHGNGTQNIFYDRDDVLTISIHQENCFPANSGGLDERGEGKGKGYNVNIPLPPGSGHETYLHAMRQLVIPTLEGFRPGLIIIASGLDANAVDPLARQMLYSGSYREMTQLLMDVASAYCGGRLVAVHEGGYAESAVPFCGQAIVETLAGISTSVVDPFEPDFIAQQPNDRVVTFHRKIIDEMKTRIGI